ncbi:cobyrinic acid a,c-diamide synthase [Oryzisolibacter propanilivorax]|uniref:Cobyrinic acid a,c-diamide synthase n=1 Tax=Oryzisolibacter propanilivorax TaxID=1527607 RepID=A0A1G9PDM8_9BURK|nr:cobyrinate a,c-diamide synthase [Oryzisolibacter propanilivorax]SDL96653.1 cobyrinic acid a,c-diamide synthase [Oryzisolibacter propanilivorax]
MSAPSARCPALVVAAPASGQGKTTVVAALARLHARAGRRVRVFKCGADYLDPHWHELASGAPVHPLDLWMTGEADCRQRLHAAAAEADLILVEGVMGLFDGDASVAALARRLGIPVLAVIDAHAMGGTFGALALGLRSYWPDLPWAGVLANRVAGERHARMLQDGLRSASDWLGALPPVSIAGEGRGKPGGLLPERQLGLVAARELPDALVRLDAAANALAATPLGMLSPRDWQRWAVDFAAPPDAPAAPAPLLAGRRVAVARDAAFCLVYEANLQTLRQLGAQVEIFAPLQGEPLPACDALWLPGGFPELHASALASLTHLREQLRRHIAAGRPVWAEGGGMLALLQSVTLADGCCLPLWDLLPGHATLRQRLQGLGPRSWQPVADGAQSLAKKQAPTAARRLPDATPAAPVADGALRGHTFHYSSVDAPDLAITGHAVRPAPEEAQAGAEPVYRHGSVHASYFHAWFPSAPRAVARLLGATP